MSWTRWLTVMCLVLSYGIASAETDALRVLDVGLRSLANGQPVPIRNRPIIGRARLGVGNRPGPARPADTVEPEEFGAILEFDGTREQLEAAGLRVGTQAGDLFTVRMRRGEIAGLSGLPGLRRARLECFAQPLLDASLVDIRANLEHGASGNPPVYSGRTGRGVIVGIIDTGIDFTRPDFSDASGATRILSIWDQTDFLGPHPTGFAYGSEYSRTLIAASPGLVRQMDFEGHGTLVAGILCGSGVSTGCGTPAYRYVGVAPEAEIIAIKTTFTDAAIVDAVQYAFNRAGALGKDCVVNLSLGSQSGAHDGSDDMSRMISALTGPGRIAVAAAGNSQIDDIHGRLTTSSTSPGVDRFVVEVPTYIPTAGAFNDYFAVAGWYNPDTHVTIQIVGPNPADTLSAGVGVSRSLNTAGGKIVLIHQAPGLGFGGTATARQFEFEVYDSLAANTPTPGSSWQVRVVADGAADLGKRADIWVYSSQLGLNRFAYVSGGLDATTLVGQPADGDSVLAVAAHTTKLSWSSCAWGPGQRYNTGQTLGGIGYFSSRGPRRDGVLKPDISAPGLGVASLHSTQAPEIPAPYDVDDGVHEMALGTSFSSPHAAGAAALFLQFVPGAAPSTIKQAFASHAREDSDTGFGLVPNAIWGAGKLDIYASLSHLTPVVVVASPFGGEALIAGATQTIRWSAAGPNGINGVDVDYSLNDRSGPWNSILARGANTGSTPWTLPAQLSDNVVVRITAHDAGTLQSTSYSGRFRIVLTVGGSGIRLAVRPPSPNPIHGAFTVNFVMPDPGPVVVSIVGVDGRSIWSRDFTATAAGPYSLDWDGRLSSGESAPSGVYFVTLSSPFGTRSSKLVLLR